LSSSVDNSRKSKSAKKEKFRQNWRPTGTTYHTCSEKGHWSSKCPKKGEDKKHTKPGGSAHMTIESSGN